MSKTNNTDHLPNYVMQGQSTVANSISRLQSLNIELKEIDKKIQQLQERRDIVEGLIAIYKEV